MHYHVKPHEFIECYDVLSANEICIIAKVRRSYNYDMKFISCWMQDRRCCYLPYRAMYTLWLWTFEFTTYDYDYDYDSVSLGITIYAYDYDLRVHYLWLRGLGFATYAYAYAYVLYTCAHDKKIADLTNGSSSGSLNKYLYTHSFLCYNF